ncbi:MAG: DUF4832 domain-containing protein [Kiritimatiellae bacterium]|nr:DUF4832 domain-containing protein [Kiritimatiellia bacterium]
MIASARHVLAPLCVLLTLTPLPIRAGTASPAKTSADLNNPHKGFMLWGTDYADGAPDNFYGSTVFHVYMPWREVETADQQFAWAAFESNHLQPILNDYSNATFVLRPVADYPDGENSGITLFYTGGELVRDYPKFLELAPLNIGYHDYTSCDGDGPGRTPDWNDPAMVTQMTQFIAALQARYDGDPRITCIQVGLLGLWAEWHQSGCDAWGPDTNTKAVVKAQYAAVFTNTPLQTRYPRDPDAVGVEFGFHEDYFPSFTAECLYGFPECDDSGDWSMYYCFQNVTTASVDNWKSNPISGESPLVTQKRAWSNDFTDIMTVLREYHFSFLGPAGGHEWDGNDVRMEQMKRALGYNYHIERFDWPDDIELDLPFTVTLVLTNSGSAPCYHHFPVELSLCDGSDNPVWTGEWAFDLRQVTPGALWTNTETFTVTSVSTGEYSIRIAILDPRFGNQPGVLIQSAGKDSRNRYAMGSIDLHQEGVLDLDADGMPDAWENERLGGTHATAEGDSDKDGGSNRDEYIWGTDPSNILDAFRIGISWTDGAVVFSAPTTGAVGVGYAGAERRYGIEQATGLLPSAWNLITGFTNILGTNQTVLYTNSLPDAGAYYRAKVWLERP